MPARIIYIRLHPRIEIDQTYAVPGTLCPMCKYGKIKHGFIIDGECCVQQVKDLYVCVDCKTVYPQYNLTKYIGNQLPYNPYNAANRRNRN